MRSDWGAVGACVNETELTKGIILQDDGGVS
jgi:hypothetical protein